MIQMRLSEAAECLQASFTGKDVVFKGCSTDTRTLEKDSLFIALHGENFNGHDFIEQATAQGAVAAMVDGAVADKQLPKLEVENTGTAMAQLAGAWRDGHNIPLVAVTGSNGKTTVKEMLTAILSENAEVLSTRGNLNNEIGVPLTLFGLGKQHEVAVIEMGANHPGEIARLTRIAKPTVALITLCAPSHIEGFGSIEGVARAKAEIFSGLSTDGTAIINADDDYADFWKGVANDCRQLTFALDKPADVSARDLQLQERLSSFTLVYGEGEVEIAMNLLGLHNIHNALAAAACCLALGVPLQQIRNGLQKIKAVKGRMQRKAGIRNVTLIDDTYNANPASLGAAIYASSETANRCWLVLGDMAELGDMAVSAHHQAGEQAHEAGIERLFTLGSLSRHASETFGQGAKHFEDIQGLIDVLSAELEEGITLLVKGSRSMAMERVINALEQEG